MKKIFIAFLLLTLMIPNMVFAENRIETQVPDEVLKVAIQGLELAKNKIKANPEEWGYSNNDDISKCTLGEGYRLYYLDVNKLTSNKLDSDKISDKIAFDKIEVWQFTVDLEGQPKSFITVAFEEGGYKVVEFGGNAENFGKAKEIFNKSMLANDINDKPILIQYQMTKYFTSIESNSEFMLKIPYSDSELATCKIQSSRTVIDEILETPQHIKPGQRGGSAINSLDNNKNNNTGNFIFLGISGVFIFMIYKSYKKVLV